jgi:hypothetical protein
VSDFVYLYGFVPPDAPAPDGLVGIADRNVELMPTGGVNAVMSDAPADAYAPDRVEARLKDLQWVAEQGIAHERVVAWFVDHSQILPVPLFTMYSSRSALLHAAEQRNAELASELKRLHGHREWDVKVFFDEAAMQENAAKVSEKVAQLDQEIAAAPAGRGYLLQRKRADLLKSEVQQAAHRRALGVLDAVKSKVAETRTLPLPRTEDVLPVVLHAALLVRNEQEAGVVAVLQAQTAELKSLGMDLSFSGPWAPYRFTGEHE